MIDARPPMRLIGGFESTYQPAFDVDVAETTGHTIRWRDDLELLRACGVADIRYPIRWHRIEPSPGRFEWDETDRILDYMAEHGLHPIADLLHHTSYPRWVGDFGDRSFGSAFLRYVEAFAARYSWIPAYTLFNEPFTTFLLCGYEGIWPPHLRGLSGFVRLARNVLPALVEASRICSELLPEAHHVYVDVCERATAGSVHAAPFVEFVNDRRFFITDLALGQPVSPDRPFAAAVIAAGGEDLLELDAMHVDVLGLDYYAHNQWVWTDPHDGRPYSSAPPPLADVIVEYWERYRVPCIIGETNVRGFASDRATWFKYVLEQCETARTRAAVVEGLCWFPFVDSCDWDSVLCRADRRIDPVGVMWLDTDFRRRESSMSASYRAAATGTRAAALPAYRLQQPLATQLAGWLPQMSHWNWQAPPPHEIRQR